MGVISVFSWPMVLLDLLFFFYLYVDHSCWFFNRKPFQIFVTNGRYSTNTTNTTNTNRDSTNTNLNIHVGENETESVVFASKWNNKKTKNVEKKLLN